MKPRDNAGRQFSEDIEKLLHGEEPSTGNADVDYMETVQFARRLLDLGQEPDSDFALKLRRRLLTNMAAQDVPEKDSRSWFVQLFSRPGLRLALVSTFVVIAAVGLIWRAGFLSPMATPPAEDAAPGMLTAPPAPLAPEAGGPQMARVPDDGAKDSTMAAATSPTTTIVMEGYVEPTAAFGQEVGITLVFRNDGAAGYFLTPFPPSVAIREAETGRIVFTFVEGTSSLELSAMESIQYDLVWDQRGSGGAQVEPGRYEVDVEMMDAQLEKGGESVPAGAGGIAAFDILPETVNGTVGAMVIQEE